MVSGFQGAACKLIGLPETLVQGLRFRFTKVQSLSLWGLCVMPRVCWN